jgi:membrane-associated phospholipid phosphatase
MFYFEFEKLEISKNELIFKCNVKLKNLMKNEVCNLSSLLCEKYVSIVKVMSFRLSFILLLFTFISISERSSAQNIDIRLLREINLHRNTSLDGTFKFITNSAAPVTFATPVVLYSVGLINSDSILKRKALVVGASVITAAVITTIMKKAVNRTRPYVTYPDIQKLSSGGSGSFPSGHTSDAFSFATSMSLEFPKWYVIAPSYAWATAVAYSRMDFGVHYPSDVLMGAIVGAGSAYLCYYLNKKLFSK